MSESDFTGGDISAAMTAAAGDSPAPTTETSAPATASASAGTTAPPAATSVPASATTTAAATASAGEPPKERWPDILANTRTKEREAVMAEWKDYAWVRQVPAGDLREFAERAIRSKGDPIAFLTEMAQEIAADPVHGQALRSLAARQLAAGRGQTAKAQADAEPQPDTEIVNEHGQVVGQTYSAKKQALREAWLKQQWLGEVRAEMAPLQQSHEKAIATEREIREKAEASSWSGEFGNELRTYPGYEENKQEIGQIVLAKLQQLPHGDKRGNDAVYLENLTRRAYNQVVLPKLQQTQLRSAVQTINQKTNAASIAHPSAQTVAAPTSTKDLSWSDALKREWARVAG